MTGEYEEKKAAYENLAAGLESNMSKLEQVILTQPSLTHSKMNHFPFQFRMRARARFHGSVQRHFRAQSIKQTINQSIN